jgi:hypothetical protein
LLNEKIKIYYRFSLCGNAEINEIYIIDMIKAIDTHFSPEKFFMICKITNKDFEKYLRMK